MSNASKCADDQEGEEKRLVHSCPRRRLARGAGDVPAFLSFSEGMSVVGDTRHFLFSAKGLQVLLTEDIQRLETIPTARGSSA